MQSSLLTFINLSWGEIGMTESVGFPFSSLRKGKEPIEKAVERYVIGYLSFWNIAFIDKHRMRECNVATTREKAREKIQRYAEQHPPVRVLPGFYLVFLNQPQVACDADSLSDVFCL